ncbi:retrovirus-related pol polyprotein from transposon TNT 1-94 [Tanacetum coccineum]
MVEKKSFDEVVLRCSRLENHNVNLELKLQHQKGSFLNNRPLNNQNAHEILEFFKINEWQTKLDAKDVSIANLRKHIESLKGKNVIEKVAQSNIAKVIAPGMFKLDLEALSPKVLRNKDAHIDYIKHTQENADILRELVKHARALRPLDSDLDSACKWKSTRQTFTLAGNTCPLTRITSTTVEPLKETTSKLIANPNPEIKIYRCLNCSLIAKITGYGDYQVKLLSSKDEASEVIIKCLKQIQVRLNATIRNVQTNNRTAFVNKNLREYYETVRISHQTSAARTLQQNGIVKRRNRTLLEAARTILIFSKAPLFLWAEADIACYTQNRPSYVSVTTKLHMS